MFPWVTAPLTIRLRTPGRRSVDRRAGGAIQSRRGMDWPGNAHPGREQRDRRNSLRRRPTIPPTGWRTLSSRAIRERAPRRRRPGPARKFWFSAAGARPGGCFAAAAGSTTCLVLLSQTMKARVHSPGSRIQSLPPVNRERGFRVRGRRFYRGPARLPVFTCPAQWLSQTINLKAGWNAVYLHVDPSHDTLDQSGWSRCNNPILEVWLWTPNALDDAVHPESVKTR